MQRVLLLSVEQRGIWVWFIITVVHIYKLFYSLISKENGKEGKRVLCSVECRAICLICQLYRFSTHPYTYFTEILLA